MTISYQYVTDSATYSAASGSPVTVNLYLHEIADTSFIAANGGLFGAGVAVQTTGRVPLHSSFITNIVTNTAAIGVGGGFGADTVWNRTNVSVGGKSAALVESIGLVQPEVGSTPDSNGLILLGSVTIQAGLPGTVTKFAVGSFANLTSNFLAYEFGEGNTITSLGPLSGFPFDLDADDNYSNGGGATYQGANDVINTFTITAV